MTAIEFFKVHVQKEFRRYALESGQKNRVTQLYTSYVRGKTMSRKVTCTYCVDNQVEERNAIKFDDNGEDKYLCGDECFKNFILERGKEKEGE